MRETLEIYAIEPLLVAIFFAIAVAGAGLLVLLFQRAGGVFRAAASFSTTKLAAIEGLRGILAAAVVAHHCYYWYHLMQTGTWSSGHTIIFNRLGNFGVLQFFFLSGFLFWRKLMKFGHMNKTYFYLSRFVRIGPAYYVCIGIALFVGLLFQPITLSGHAGAIAKSTASWLLFSLNGRPLVGGVDLHRITCGVTWTLAFEWLFYLTLPFLGWFARKDRRLFLLLGITAVLAHFHRVFSFGPAGNDLLESAGSILSEFPRFMLLGFGVGIVVASQDRRLRTLCEPISAWRNWVILGLYLFYLMNPWFADLALLPLAMAFCLVAQGGDLFGFLSCRPVRFLGLISYPMYLVHGVVLYFAMKVRGGVHPVDPRSYVLETAGWFILVLLVSAMVHVFVERPTMRLSEEIAKGSAKRVTHLATVG